MKKHGRCAQFVTDKLRSYGAALKDLGVSDRQETGRWLNNRGENSHLPFRRRERAMLRFRRMRSLQKNSPPSTPPSPTTSTASAASLAEPSSSRTAPPLLLSGAALAQHKRQRHCPS